MLCRLTVRWTVSGGVIVFKASEAATFSSPILETFVTGAWGEVMGIETLYLTWVLRFEIGGDGSSYTISV